MIYTSGSTGTPKGV
ncbi:hypothetical protein ACQR7S_27680 [Klebsiella pneumoniae]